MDQKAFLLQLWVYERWANGEWFGALGRFSDEARARAVMRHIYSCYSGWVGLVDAEWQHDRRLEPTESDFERVAQAWERAIGEGDLEGVLDWGDGRQISLGELAHHVLNHGTYHRGHLRGLAEAQGLEDFPDTDSVKYFTWVRAGTLN